MKYTCISTDVKMGRNVKLADFVNIFMDAKLGIIQKLVPLLKYKRVHGLGITVKFKVIPLFVKV